MVMYNPRQWFSLIFHSYSKRVMLTLLPALIFMGVFTTVVCYVFIHHLHWEESDFQPTIAMHSLLGIVLGLFLVFRTNTAYDRWWEGRKLWGALVNSTRNMALKLDAYIARDDHETRDWFSKMISNFVYATKESLRNGVQFNELESVSENFHDDLKKYKHKP